jgi:ATP-dependent protease ClpP protease subunit
LPEIIEIIDLSLFFGGFMKLLLLILSSLMLLLASPAKSEIVLTEGNTVSLKGSVTQTSIYEVTQSLGEHQNSKEKVYLLIDSPGGSVFAGLDLAYYLKTSGKNVTCISKTAISMAFVILQACNERISMDNSVHMQHVASYGVEGDAPNNLSFVMFLEKTLKIMQKMQAERLGLSVPKFNQKTRNDWWLFGGEEPVKHNITDKTETVTCSPKLYEKKEIMQIATMFGPINVEVSGCPLVSGGKVAKNQAPGSSAKALDTFELRSILSNDLIADVINGKITKTNMASFK